MAFPDHPVFPDHPLSRRKALAAVLGLFATALAAGRPAQAQSGPRIIVTRDPGCGCCSAWAGHLALAGFDVKIVESREMEAVKRRLGVPPDLAACHTAEAGGYVIEGHVPVAAIERLLTEKPLATGVAVAGMPAGSPGMEGAEPENYEVVLFGPGQRTPYGRFRGDVQLGR